jgi:hypothetical protein
MSTPTAAVNGSQMATQADLEEELRQAEQDFARGDFIELTIEQLDRCVAAGEWPWPDESSDEAPRFARASKD